MKKPNFLNKFTIIDYIIIICVIIVIIFAFIHINSDIDTNKEITSFDSSTMNKIVEKYLDYYKDAYIVKTTLKGTNSSNGEDVSIKGEIIWMDDDRGSNTKILIKNKNTNYLASLYNDVPEADIYIKTVSLEINGEKYLNVKDFTISPQKINSIMDLTNILENKSNYELTTTITTNNNENQNYQNIINKLYENHGKISIKPINTGLQSQLRIIRASFDDLNLFNQPIDGISSQITIRVYNCTDKDIQLIQNAFNVTNIRNVS